ncbi:hypothetical protein M422DRAFT_247643 [Sphaerobolus stellatus SS14]|nr:hypothetical protein M422DRAFT_247643 [Sphaerobolus stellatus SS14]
MEGFANKCFCGRGLSFKIPGDLGLPKRKHFRRAISVTSLLVRIHACSQMTGGTATDVYCTAQGILGRHGSRDHVKQFINNWEAFSVFRSSTKDDHESLDRAVMSLTRRQSIPATIYRNLVRPATTPCDHKDRRWTDRWQATVGANILLESALFTGLSAMVTCISELTAHNLSVSNSLLTVLGIVLGLVVGFRTSSAYERYQEGRKLWADIAVASGNLGQLIWSHVPDGVAVLGSEETCEKDPAQNEKKEVLRLIQAFSISVKQFICAEQREQSVAELYMLLPWLKQSAPMTSPAATLNNSPGLTLQKDIETGSQILTKPTQTEQGEKPSRRSYIRRFIRWLRKTEMSLESVSRDRAVCQRCPPSPIIPLQITLSLHHYVKSLRVKLKDEVPELILGAILNNLDGFQHSVNNLERIRSTPIPYAYQVHLKLSLWVYLIFLPFQVVDTMKWLTIPGTLFASMLLLGFHAIGQQIENPFNGDANDLNMDAFCNCIANELEEIVTVRIDPMPIPANRLVDSFLKNPVPDAFLHHMNTLRREHSNRPMQVRSGRRDVRL